MPLILPRSYTGGAAPSSLVAAMSATSPGGGASFEVSTTTGWPTGDYVVAVIDRGTVLEETVLIQSIDATTCVLASGGRGYDGTDAKAHDAGAPIEHTFDATAAQKLVDHVNDKVDDDVHPQLLRTAAHTLPAHDDLGLQTKVGHDQALHTSPPLSLLSQAAHDLALHQSLGLMSDDEYTAEHTAAAHDALGFMRTSAFTKGAIDDLDVDGKTWDGWSHTGLRTMVMPKVLRNTMDSGPTGMLTAGTNRTMTTVSVGNPPKTFTQTHPLYLVMFGGTISFYLSGAGGGVPPVDVVASLTGPGPDTFGLNNVTIYESRTHRVSPGYTNLAFTTQMFIPDVLPHQWPTELRIRARLSEGDADAQVVSRSTGGAPLWFLLMPLVDDTVDVVVGP